LNESNKVYANDAFSSGVLILLFGVFSTTCSEFRYVPAGLRGKMYL